MECNLSNLSRMVAQTFIRALNLQSRSPTTSQLPDTVTMGYVFFLQIPSSLDSVSAGRPRLYKLLKRNFGTIRAYWSEYDLPPRQWRIHIKPCGFFFYPLFPVPLINGWECDQFPNLWSCRTPISLLNPMSPQRMTSPC